MPSTRSPRTSPAGPRCGPGSARHAEIYARYRPVFHAFPAASESDEAVAAGSARWGERIRSKIRSSLDGSTLPARQLEPVIGLAQECLTRTLDITAILQSVVPGAFPTPRIGDATTDVIHRALFGLLADVNVHPPVGRRPPTVEFQPGMRELFEREDLHPDGVGARARRC